MTYYKITKLSCHVSILTQISYSTSNYECLHFPGTCVNITHRQCQILPYHSTLAPLLPIVKNMDTEKFLKFFTYLHRLGCYQHILLFGCSLAFPKCIVDGDDRYFGIVSFKDKSPVILETSVQEEQIIPLLTLLFIAFKGEKGPASVIVNCKSLYLENPDSFFTGRNYSYFDNAVWGHLIAVSVRV